jgi:hypothetical protein
MANELILKPLGFGGDSIILSPLGFTASGAEIVAPKIKKIYWNGVAVPSLTYVDNSSVSKTVLKVYYGSTLVWES